MATIEIDGMMFTQPSADGLMYCDGQQCFGAGQLAGAHPFVVGHRTLKDAAQHWYLDRNKLVEAYARDLKQPWPFMKKENVNASSKPAAA